MARSGRSLHAVGVEAKELHDMQQNALEIIDEVRARVVSGETLRNGLIECRKGSEYSNAFSSGMNKREDAAMLIDLGLRLMGFVSRNKDDKFI